MSAARRNLELKARDADPERSLAVCKSLEAEDRGTLLQEDVYFSVPRGRLKLRRQEGIAAQLIAYHRPDLPGQRESHYRIVEVEDAAALEATLGDALGIAAVVKKSRRLFLLEGVRIHLDRVAGLGSFIELEGVAEADEDLPRFQVLLKELRRSFGIDDAGLLAESYCDLVLAARRPG
jgi:adenylate cyclase, class 2